MHVDSKDALYSIMLIFKNRQAKVKNDAEMVKINGWLKINRT